MAEGAEFEAEVGGQKFAARGLKDVNTIVTMLTFCVLLGGGGVLYSAVMAHDKSAGEGARALADAIKEQISTQRELTREQVSAQRAMTEALRERNCLDRFDAKQRQDPENINFCKQISR